MDVNVKMNDYPRFAILIKLPEFENVPERYSLISSTDSLHYLNIIASAIKKSNKKSDIYWVDTYGRHGVWQAVWRNRKVEFEKVEDDYVVYAQGRRGEPRSLSTTKESDGDM